MERIAALTGLKTTATAVSTTRPTTSGHGVAVTTWKQGSAFQLPSFLVTLVPDADRTLDSPTGGALGPEIWSYIDSAWILVGYFRLEALIAVPATGYGELVGPIVVGDRLIVAGTKSGGTMTYAFTPVERHIC
jgi:hypothetical protein